MQYMYLKFTRLQNEIYSFEDFQGQSNKGYSIKDYEFRNLSMQVMFEDHTGEIITFINDLMMCNVDKLNRILIEK